MLFYGPSGAGKKTRIACTLRELFGKGADKVRSPNVSPCRLKFVEFDSCGGCVGVAQD